MLIDVNEEYIYSDVDIRIDAIKTIFLMLFIYYTNFKITNKKLELNFKLLRDTLIIAIFVIIRKIINIEFNFWVNIISSILIMSIIFSKDKIIKSIIATSISYAVNYIILGLAVIFNFAFNSITKLDNDYINLIIILISQMFLLYKFWNIRKFKNGFFFLKDMEKSESIDILVLNISIVVLFLITILANSDIVLARDSILGTITAVIIMFITIQKSLQLYYKQKLLEQELNKTKEELANRNKDIEELEAENIEISKKAHTLTHKQKALSHKLDEMMMSAEISKEEAAEVKDRLNEIGKELYKEKNATALTSTGIPQIDDMLKFMQSECSANKIDFELQIKGNIHYMTNNLIPKEDLETLLADHIKNAIIAINHTENVNRSILVKLGKIDETYGLYIYDSGIEFEKETLENLGKKPSTTHKDEGGTGMGFMNTFDTLRKCKASLIIEELNKPEKDNYTKAIMIKFDNQNEFKIKSYRKKEMLINSALQV